MTFSQLILASASPRRKALLATAGLTFDVVESGIDETRLPSEDSCTYATRIAANKALHVSTLHPNALVLGADTVVDLDGEILLKPLDPADARRMLRALSGATHTVVTAFALARGGLVLENHPVLARVTFRPLTNAIIDAYLTTGEPFDKAGSYGIQGAGADFILSVEGSRDTVMGLPVREVLTALQLHGYAD